MIRDEKSISVCMFSNLFQPVVSGSSTQSRSLSRELTARGHRPFVITARVDPESPDFEEVEGVPVYRLPCIRMPKLPIALNFPWISYTFTPGNQRRIREILEKHQPDVLHLHNHMFDLAFSAVRMKKKFSLPLVITIHTMIRHAKPIYNMLLYPGDRLGLRYLVARHAETLICPDVNIEDYVRQAFPGTQPALVPYGIELPARPTEDHIARLRHKHGLNGQPLILSLGHVHEVRNRRDLIRALPVIKKTVPDIKALIVGAEVTDTPRKLARELGVEDSVIFAGHAPHEDVPAYLAMADLEMHLFYQDVPEKTSFGIASLEAMGAGKTVLVAANPDTYGQGLLRDDKNFVLAEQGNPNAVAGRIVELLNDAPRRQRIGQAAEKVVRENFSWESICRRTLDVYRDASDRFGIGRKK